jgi:hypothetical protein
MVAQRRYQQQDVRFTMNVLRWFSLRFDEVGRRRRGFVLAAHSGVNAFAREFQSPRPFFYLLGARFALR